MSKPRFNFRFCLLLSLVLCWPLHAQEPWPAPPRRPSEQPVILPVRWDAQLRATLTNPTTIAGRTYFSSTRLNVTWTAPNQAVDHYEISAIEQSAAEAVGGTRVAATRLASSVVLQSLKSATLYLISLTGCVDAACARAIRAASTVSLATPEEVWQLQGTGNSMTTVKLIVNDGNVGSYAFRYGEWAGAELAGKVQLYYNPMGGTEKGVKTALSNSADFSSFTPLPGYGLLQACPPAPPNSPPKPCLGTSFAASVALFQAVPLAAHLGARVRLFFEALGTDQRTRILYLDSQDGYLGRDFNPGPDTQCRTLADYAAGGACEPQVAIGVQGDAVNGNARVQNARQFKIAYPQRDDVRWDGAAGTPMIFTVNTDGACSSRNFTQGYAVWDGANWQVQYAANGCPKLFEAMQAPLPVHLGGTRYKLYYSNNATSRTQPGSFNNKPMKVIYADTRATGQAGVLDFEDWETVNQAREVQYLFPDGSPLTLADESQLDDFMMLLPTNDPDWQVMYTNTAPSNSTTPPTLGMAVLVNP